MNSKVVAKPKTLKTPKTPKTPKTSIFSRAKKGLKTHFSLKTGLKAPKKISEFNSSRRKRMFNN